MVVATTILDVDHLTFLLNGMEECFFKTLYVLSYFNFIHERMNVLRFKNIWRICHFKNVWVQIKGIYYMLHIALFNVLFFGIDLSIST